MSEFIGSRISLISKSDIKYVGTLHEINSENSTVALENVRSYGTEGRRGKPEEEVPPSDQNYEYIVFRGSDVKDLTIIEQAPKETKAPQMPNDPAILGSARPQQPQHQPPSQYGQQWQGPPPPQNFPPHGYPQQNSRFAPPGGPHGFPGAPGAVPGYGFGGPPNGMAPPPGWYPPNAHGFPHGPPGGPGGPGGPFPPQNQRPSPLQENQRPGQKPSGPGAQQPPPLPTDSKPTELSATPATSHAPPPSKETKPEPPSATKASAPTEPSKPKQPASNPRVAVPFATRAAAPKPETPAQQIPSTTNQTQASTKSATDAAAAAVAAAMAKLGPVTGKAAPQPQQSGVDSIARKIGELSTNGEAPRGGRGRGRGGLSSTSTRGDATGSRGPRRGGAAAGAPRHQPVEVPTTDFDFESSNAKFNKQDLVKQAIASGSPASTPIEEGNNLDNAGAALEGASAAPTDGAAEDDVVIPAAGQAMKYDKTSSFFDNISSELKDRQAAEGEGKRFGGAEFRSEERKRNMETFGESSPFRGRGRGGYVGGRGGGGYGGRGRGYGGRGGGGYRGRGGAAAEA